MNSVSYEALSYPWLTGDAKGFAKYLESAKDAFKNTPRRKLDEVIGQSLVDIGGGLRAAVIRLTPVMAWELLIHHNLRNRPISFVHSTKVAMEIEAGRWGLTHQGGAFNSEDDCEDMQHRLAGVAMSGKPIDIVIMHGLADDLFKRIDIGKVRPLGSALALSGHNGKSNLLGAVIRDMALPYDEKTVSFFRNSTKIVRKRYVGPEEAADYAEDHPALEEAIHEALETHAAGVAALIEKKVGVFVYYRIREDWGQDVADDFMEQLGSEQPNEKSPIGALQRRIDKHKLGKLANRNDVAARKHIVNPMQILWLTAAAFRAYRKGQRIGGNVRLDPRGDDEFPRFEESMTPQAEAAE